MFRQAKANYCDYLIYKKKVITMSVYEILSLLLTELNVLVTVFFNLRR